MDKEHYKPNPTCTITAKIEWKAVCHAYYYTVPFVMAFIRPDEKRKEYKRHEENNVSSNRYK